MNKKTLSEHKDPRRSDTCQACLIVGFTLGVSSCETHTASTHMATSIHEHGNVTCKRPCVCQGDMAYLVDPCHTFRRSLPYISEIRAVPFGEMDGGKKLLREENPQAGTVLTMVVRNVLQVRVSEVRAQSLKMDLMRKGVGAIPDERAVEIAYAVLKNHVDKWHDGVRAYRPRLAGAPHERVMKLSWVESGPRGTQFSVGIEFDMQSLTKESATMAEVMES